MGSCECVPSRAEAIPQKTQKAVMNGPNGKEAGLSLVPFSSVGAVLEVSARAMCGTRTAAAEALTSWVVSTGALADVENPERLGVMRWLAQIKFDMDWRHSSTTFCLGGVHDGELGAICLVYPMYQGYAAEHGFFSEALPFLSIASMLAAGKTPATVTRNREWRRGFLPKLLGKNGLDNLMKEGHQKHAEGPHYYISLMMVDPSLQGKGLCGRLMRAACRAADADGLPTFLETGGARNVAVYKRFGFEVVDQLSLSAEGFESYDEMFLMVRPAAGSSSKDSTIMGS